MCGAAPITFEAPSSQRGARSWQELGAAEHRGRVRMRMPPRKACLRSPGDLSTHKVGHVLSSLLAGSPPRRSPLPSPAPGPDPLQPWWSCCPACSGLQGSARPPSPAQNPCMGCPGRGGCSFRLTFPAVREQGLGKLGQGQSCRKEQGPQA